MIHLTISACNDETAPEGVTCWSKAKRTEYLTGKNWWFMATQNYMKPENYERLLTTKLKGLIGLESWKIMNQYFSLNVKSGEV